MMYSNIPKFERRFRSDRSRIKRLHKKRVKRYNKEMIKGLNDTITNPNRKPFLGLAAFIDN